MPKIKKAKKTREKPLVEILYYQEDPKREQISVLLYTSQLPSGNTRLMLQRGAGRFILDPRYRDVEELIVKKLANLDLNPNMKEPKEILLVASIACLFKDIKTDYRRDLDNFLKLLQDAVCTNLLKARFEKGDDRYIRLELMGLTEFSGVSSSDSLPISELVQTLALNPSSKSVLETFGKNLPIEWWENKQKRNLGVFIHLGLIFSPKKIEEIRELLRKELRGGPDLQEDIQ